MQLDERLRQLMKELASAINESISDSDRIAEAIANIKEAGYDVFLVLEAAVGFQKRSGEESNRLLITAKDRRFLHSLKVRMDESGATPETVKETRFALTAQDAKFLRSLKISVDEQNS